MGQLFINFFTDNELLFIAFLYETINFQQDLDLGSKILEKVHRQKVASNLKIQRMLKIVKLTKTLKTLIVRDLIWLWQPTEAKRGQ